MSSEWDAYQIQDIAAEMGDAPFGSNLKNHDYTDSGALVVQGRNIQGRECEWSDRRYVSIEKYAQLKKNQCNVGDLVFPKVGTIGKVGLLTPAEGVDKYVLSTNTMRLRVNEKIACADFVYYFFTWPRTSALINAFNSKSVQPVFNFTSLRKFEIALPAIAEQKRISGILRALDDRITLLRETNATLEAVAQALFKSWFVDFDPVRAKAEGRQPEGMDDPTAALFPDSFVESELGMVPKGWRVGSLGDIASIKGGKQLEKEFFKDRGVNPIFGGAGVMGHTDLKNAEGFVITVGRVGAYCGQFFWHLGEAWVNNNASHIQPMRNLDAVWIYQWLRAANIDHIKKGAAQPFVSNGDLAELKLALPIGALVDRFVEVVGPVYEQMASLQAQAKTVTQLRDTLLPRLISGQLRLPDAESLMEKAL